MTLYLIYLLDIFFSNFKWVYNFNYPSMCGSRNNLVFLYHHGLIQSLWLWLLRRRTLGPSSLSTLTALPRPHISRLYPLLLADNYHIPQLFLSLLCLLRAWPFRWFHWLLPLFHNILFRLTFTIRISIRYRRLLLLTIELFVWHPRGQRFVMLSGSFLRDRIVSSRCWQMWGFSLLLGW